jgi:3',5'-cyclic AMP phosphodiesterase CpdA
MRFAHLSDLHLLSLDGTRLADFLNKRWTGGLNLALSRGRHYQARVFEALVDDLNKQHVDHVVCTGDVTNLSFESEFRFARQQFERIDHKAVDVTCIPGNHDTYVADMAGAFERVFHDYCTSDAGWDAGASGGADADPAARWPIVRVRGDLAFIGLSTSMATPWFMAHGRIGGSQLERVERLLADPRLAGKHRVVLLHHPPAGHRARRFSRGLRDHADLAQILARTGADLVLHGHEHLDVREQLSGPAGARIPVRGITAGSYEVDTHERRARYRIFSVERRDGRARLVHEETRAFQGGRFGEEQAGAPQA